MAKTSTPPLSSNHQPDPKLLANLQLSFRVCFYLVMACSSVILLVWLLPPLRPYMPYSWDEMKADTAIVVMLSALSLSFSQAMQSAARLKISRWLAAAVLLIAVAAGVDLFTGLLTGLPVGLAALLAHVPTMRTMGPMSPNTAAAAVLLGIVLLLLRERKNIYSRIADICAILLIFTMVVFVTGYIYGALRLFGPSKANHMSLPTMACLCGITFFAFSRRAEYGVFSVFLGNGIGARISRIAAPFAVLLPFLVNGARDVIIWHTDVPKHYATAISSAFTSLLAFVLIYVTARRIDRMEQEIRVLSLHDELTGLYNRRGFYLLAEQSYALSQRAGNPFSVIFVDVDGLKQVNDTLGHEVGDELLQEMAKILESGFRETDVLGRLGGDEFAIAARGSALEITTVIRRLAAAVVEANRSPFRTFQLNFSWGYSTSQPESGITLDAMLQEADIQMYDSKRSKKEKPSMYLPPLMQQGLRADFPEI